MNAVKKIDEYADTNWQALATELGPSLSQNAHENDAGGLFAAENYALLQEHGTQ